MYTYEGIPGRHVDAVLPALIHKVAPGEFRQCSDPALCSQCAPKLDVRRAFFRAKGSERDRLQQLLAIARELDAQEAAVAPPAPPVDDPGVLF